MGHDISLVCEGKTLNCFPALSGNVACYVVEGKLIPYEFQANLYITHNNGKMWYKALENIGQDLDSIGSWLDGVEAKDRIEPLEKLLIELTDKPEVYKSLHEYAYKNNQWGGYVDLCKKIQALLIACRTYPDAIIHDWY